jgi:asparagine synthase (glutamine-hydrolysing)
MCGITGVLNFDGRPADPLLLERMIRTLNHRGPDGTGLHTNGPVGLAHARLSIIDIAGGHQPMESDEGSVWITFNGEIFNYVELREELIRKGHKFSTRSDTEVILGLYLEYGPDCVQHMNGQWAFAIWDAKHRKLFLSRDRIGVRPLFYTVAAHSFIFGSELKAVLAHPGVDRKLDVQVLRQVFTFWFPLAPGTPFQNIYELPPGHSMTVENGQVNIHRYWQLDFSPADVARINSARDQEKYENEVCGLLLDATRIRLRADVPVGAYLSGGLDSSIVAALAQKYVGSKLCTFSVGFEDPSLDERSFQQEVVRSLDTDHQSICCSANDIGEVFPDVIWHAERPILRTAPAPLFLLSRLVRNSGFKVVLTGEGADEFLGGYDIYKEAKIRAFWAAQTDSKRRPLLLKRLYPYLEGLQKQSPAYLQAFFHATPKDVTNPFFSHLPRWELTRRTEVFFSPAVREEVQRGGAYADLHQLLPERFSNWSTFSRAQYLESAFLLPAYLLSSQGDRVAMAHSIEGRYPFLDYRLVQFAASLPPQLKMKVLNEKYLLKKVFGDLVPSSVKNRPKQPYRAPDAISFFAPAAGKARHPYVDELLSSDRIRTDGIFDPAAVQKLVAKAKAGRASSFLDNAALVGILATQILVDQFILHFEERMSHAADRAGSTPVCN